MLDQSKKAKEKARESRSFDLRSFLFTDPPSFLRPILNFGINAQGPQRDHAHGRLIAALSLVGILICITYVSLYLIRFGIYFAIADSLAGLLYLSNFYWLRQGNFAVPPRILLAVANAQVVVGMLVLGPKSDLSLYGILLGFGAFILLTNTSALEKWSWGSLSFGIYLFGFFAKETFEFGILLQPDLPSWYPWTSRAGAFIVCLFVMNLIIEAKNHSLADLEHNKELMDQAQKVANFGSFHTHLNSKKIVWSDELYRIYGLAPEVMPKDLFGLEMVHPEDQPFLSEKIKQLSSLSLPQQFEYRVLKGSQTLYLRVSLDAEHDKLGDLTGFHGACQNITHEKEVDQTLKDQQAKILSASKLSALGEMAGGIAHEINNPLTIITGKARQVKVRLNNGVDAKTLVGDLDLIEATAFRIAKIVQGMRSFSRDGTKDPPIEMAVLAILDDTLSLCQDRMRLHNVKLVVKNPSGEIRLLSRPVQISQVLINLINNAFDAIESLGSEDRWIQVEHFSVDTRLILKISNGGPKIPEFIVANIMKPFFTTKPPGKGTGLGLAISRGIIDDHGGRLYIDKDETYTTFVIEMDLKPSSESPLFKSA